MKPSICPRIYNELAYKSLAFFSKGGQWWFSLHNIADLLDVEKVALVERFLKGQDLYPKFHQLFHHHMMISDGMAIIIAKTLNNWEFLRNLIHLLQKYQNHHNWKPHTGDPAAHWQVFAEVSGIDMELLLTPDPDQEGDK